MSTEGAAVEPGQQSRDAAVVDRCAADGGVECDAIVGRASAVVCQGEADGGCVEVRRHPLARAPDRVVVTVDDAVVVEVEAGSYAESPVWVR